jgi:hypothetical protein
VFTGEDEDPTTHVRDVRVTVMQAAELLKADLIGKNDPYVLLRVGDEELRTQVSNPHLLLIILT